MKARAWVFALGLAAFASVAHAQPQPNESNASAEPRVVAEPPRREPTLPEKVRQWADDTQIVERIGGTVEGWYPRFGGLERGGGLAGGPGYRTHVLGNVLLDLSAAISVRNYQGLDARARWLQLLDHRLELWTDAHYDTAPQARFYGAGPETSAGAQTTYRFSNNDLVARGLFHATPWLDLGVHVGYMHVAVGPGTAPYPATQQVFTEAQAPGLTRRPTFLHTGAFVDADFRDQPGNPSRGAVYHVAVGNWNDRALHQFDFRRLEASATQFVPLSANHRHVISGRIGLALVNNASDEQVPFYFLPYVGGSDTVRGYREFRFMDENALWLSGEYAWTPRPHVSVIPFVDAGKVTHRWDQMDLGGLKTGYGIGFAIHTPKQQLARIDFAYGEGFRTVLHFGMF
jgi:hypothetical protein